MLEQLNFEGKWWLPNRTDCPFLGFLTFNQETGAVLSLIGSLDMIGEDISKHEIMLGETSEGKKITLVGISSASANPFMKDFRKSSIEFQRVFVGTHFLRSEDVKFDRVWVTYSNFDKWISHNDMHGRFLAKHNENNISITYEKCDPIMIIIDNKYQLSFIAKPEAHLPTPQLWEAHVKEKRCIELQSQTEKSFDEYVKLNGILHDFLNFIVPDEILIESIEGAEEVQNSVPHSHSHGIKQQNVQIFYKSPISNMMKPFAKSQPLLFFQELYDSNHLGSYLIRWFKIAEKFKPAFELYFGVMYNPKMYAEFQFLGLAQALESYHRISTGQDRRWLFERAKEIYECYSEIADVYFKFKDKDTFATKVKDTRNYFSHWSENLGNKAVDEKDLRLLTRDLQLLLQLCLMTELGLDIGRIKKIFHIDKMRRIR